ncbi:MAG: hypothetical protein ACE5FT_07690 [Candidatus Nanoarchaeia archaeon]
MGRDPADHDAWREFASSLERDAYRSFDNIPQWVREPENIGHLVNVLKEDRGSGALRWLFLATRNMYPDKLERHPSMPDYERLAMMLKGPPGIIPEIVDGYVIDRDNGLPSSGLSLVGHRMGLLRGGEMIFYDSYINWDGSTEALRTRLFGCKSEIRGGRNFDILIGSESNIAIDPVYMSKGCTTIPQEELYVKLFGLRGYGWTSEGDTTWIKPKVDDARQITKDLGGRLPTIPEYVLAAMGRLHDGGASAGIQLTHRVSGFLRDPTVTHDLTNGDPRILQPGEVSIQEPTEGVYGYTYGLKIVRRGGGMYHFDIAERLEPFRLVIPAIPE